MGPTVAIAERAISSGIRLGANSVYRTAHKTRHGKYVYKSLRRTRHREDIQANRREYITWLRLQTMQLPEGIFVPKMFLLPNGVLAAEYVAGFYPTDQCSDWNMDNFTLVCSKGSNCQNGCWRERLETLGLRDLHDENVLMNRHGEIWIIDLDGGFNTDPVTYEWDVDKTHPDM